ncbi:MAG: InlB B-repeat-containing protein [Bacilli bacterium]|nr:InlB B-repeat-containing protein [Bacilli bacterium]
MKKNKLFITAGLAAVMAIGIFIYAINNSKFEVKFDTDGGNKIESVLVKKNERVKAPKDPKKEGFVFVEWQLEGKTYDFKKKVTKNIKLKAKWLPEIYVTVSFDSDGGSEVAPVQIISGTTVNEDEITVPTREGYTFTGWMIGENKYDFSKKITSDLTLKAGWVEGENVQLPEEETKAEEKIEEVKDDEKAEVKEATKVEEKNEEIKKENDKKTDSEDTKKSVDTSKQDVKTATKTSTTFKVGDKVTITGEYANSCDGNKTGYKVAIGWDAEITAVYEGQEYPYRVADVNGTIGYFKAESLKVRN